MDYQGNYIESQWFLNYMSNQPMFGFKEILRTTDFCRNVSVKQVPLCKLDDKQKMWKF